MAHPWRPSDDDYDARFDAYVEQLSGCLGHQDRVEPFRAYCTGILLPLDRKSVEPMAAKLRPDRTSPAHQSLLHFVGQSPWDDTALFGAVREAVLPVMTAYSPVTSWIIDDTSFPKKGKHSVGVARQYSGQLGKQDNCQVAVSLSVATTDASLPIAWRLYLPEDWIKDEERRAKAKVPKSIEFKTKQEIALSQIKAAQAEGVPQGIILADAGYGNTAAFRDEISKLGLDYIVGVHGNINVWLPGVTPSVPVYSGRGPHPKRLRRAGDDAPVVQVKKLAENLPDTAWHTVTWREGAAGDLSSRFAAVRIRAAQGDNRRSTPRPEEWLLIEWPPGEKAATKFWLSTLPETTTLRDLVHKAKHRWVIERDYQELKQELGLGHYEGRGWRGFHHHAALCIAAYGFLVAERATFPPSGPRNASVGQEPAISRTRKRWRSTNSNRETCLELNRNPSPQIGSRSCEEIAEVSMLQPSNGPPRGYSSSFVTQ